MPEHELPLTTAEAGQAPQTDQQREIARLVDHFYGLIREDPQLGPVFNRHITDWQPHLATMREFWGAVVYRTGRYTGRPLEAHMKIAGLKREYFARWLELWGRAIEEVVTSEARGPLKAFAAQMAETMAFRLNLPPMAQTP